VKTPALITRSLTAAIVAAAVLATATPAQAASVPPRTTVRVASYNVDSAWRQKVDPSIPGWNARVQGIGRVITTAAPDVIGIQEAPDINIDGRLYRQGEDIRRQTGYTMYQPSDPAARIDPILFRGGLFDMTSAGYKVFEQKPYPNYGKVMTWVKLRSKATGQVFMVANTHFQVGADKQADRDREGILLAAEIKRVSGGVPVFVTGDFNASASKNAPQTKNLATLGITDTHAMTSSRMHGEYKTYNGYQWPVIGSSRIDQVYAGAPAAKDLKVSYWENWTAYGNQIIGGREPSDHDMIYAVASFR
jgi:endonuclease/exonuclease/phosphatase family metal-dependent hydrolase